MSVADLPGRHGDFWAQATRHPFLTAVRDCTLPDDAFDRWLAQDHRFVADLLRFQARLLGRAPRAAQSVLAAGAVALVNELAWFEDQATRRRLDLAKDPLPATLAYARVLDRLDDTDPPLALAMLWVLERAYLEAWSYAATRPADESGKAGAPAYRACVEHWTAPEFAAYVDRLRAAADDTIGDGALLVGGDLDALFREIVETEIAFWDMAWEDPHR